MPAYLQHPRSMRPRERALALAAVAFVQLALGVALLTGLRVQFSRSIDAVQRLIQINLPEPPPPTTPEAKRTQEHRPEASPKAEPKPLGGSPGPRPAHAPPLSKDWRVRCRLESREPVAGAGRRADSLARRQVGRKRSCTNGGGAMGVGKPAGVAVRSTSFSFCRGGQQQFYRLSARHADLDP